MGAYVIRIEVDETFCDEGAIVVEVARALHKGSVPLRDMEYLGRRADESAPAHDVTSSDGGAAGAADAHS